MEYQVWIKEDFTDNWRRVDCGDLAAARGQIDQAVRTGGYPILTVEVPYEVSIKVSEVGSEVKKGKPSPDKGAGAEGKGEVRPGDAGAVQKFN